MSKIICDVCGTSYAETAAQCPICGCVRHGNTAVLATETSTPEESTAGTYTYVKGGRFSKANVRKRLQDGQGFSAGAEAAPEGESQPGNEKKNTGLVVAILLLLLAIVAVVIYIVMRFLMPGSFLDSSNIKPSATQSATVATTEATELVIPCTELKLSTSVIEMETQNMAQLLNVTKVPADTTDVVTFTSSDENVATVTAGGKITAVAPGQAVITITCGNVKAECRVVCSFETVPPTDETVEATTEATTEPTTAPTESTASEREFKLNRTDFTLSNKGDTWQLYTGSISKSDIKWSTDDPLVATIENGVVTAVGGGKTYVYGEYNGVKEKCIVRCSFAPTETQPEGTEAPTETQPSSGKTYTISHTDVTLRQGETFTLTLKDENGTVINVTWTTSKSDCHTISGNQITGKKATDYAVVSTVYEGKTYSCIVRVR